MVEIKRFAVFIVLISAMLFHCCCFSHLVMARAGSELWAALSQVRTEDVYSW